MQNVDTLIRRPVSLGSAAASGLLAFVAGAAIALTAPGLIAGLPLTRGPIAIEPAGIVEAQQIAHNRSEGELADSSSAGGQQIAHNRSEEDLGSSVTADRAGIRTLMEGAS